ncbi:hypothetical protein TNIN_148351, partial [Trichonephila inaurata madagascariensis]
TASLQCLNGQPPSSTNGPFHFLLLTTARRMNPQKRKLIMFIIHHNETLLLVNNHFLCSRHRSTFLCLSCPLYKDQPLLSKLEARLPAQRIPRNRNLCENGISHAYTPKRIHPTEGGKRSLACLTRRAKKIVFHKGSRPIRHVDESPQLAKE